MNCSICNVWIAETEAAFEADWIPGYWDGDEECGPCCRKCWMGNTVYIPDADEYVWVEKGKVA